MALDGETAAQMDQREQCMAITDELQNIAPICAGGLAIIGCTNPDECSEIWSHKMRALHPNLLFVSSRNQDGTEVIEGHSIPRYWTKFTSPPLLLHLPFD